MNPSGQAYLIALIVITLFVFGLFFVSFRGAGQAISQPNKAFFENAQNEMVQSYTTAVYLKDIPTVMGGTALLFKKQASATQQQLDICFTVFDQNNAYYFGNYSNKDSNAISTYSNSPVKSDSTQSIQKQNLLNDLNLSFCSKSFNLNNALNLSITLRKGKGAIEWQSQE